MQTDVDVGNHPNFWLRAPITTRREDADDKMLKIALNGVQAAPGEARQTATHR
jgi:hypothetical protein